MTAHKVYLSTVGKNGDVRAEAYKLLESVPDFTGMDMSEKRVLLKPNFVAPFEKAVTDFRIIAAAADFVRSKGGTPFIAESSGFEFDTEKTFNILGVYEFGKNENIEVINLDNSDFRCVKTNDKTFPELLLAEDVYKADLIFNLPRLKHHSLTNVTFSVKNLMGLIHRDTRRLFHSKSIEHGIAVLSEAVKSDLIVVDGLLTLSRAVYGDDDYKGLLLAGNNSLAVDKVCCDALGVDHYSIPHLTELDNSDHRYEKNGDLPKVTEQQREPGGIYKAIFRSAYILDRILKSFGREQSIIPQLHWYFGIRPAVGKADREALEKGAEICPVNAIDVDSRCIVKDKCINIRCLKCVEVEPKGSFIIKKGFRRTDG